MLAGAPRLSCRIGRAGQRSSATPNTIARSTRRSSALTATYSGLTQRVPSFYDDVKAAGALAVFESNWS